MPQLSVSTHLYVPPAICKEGDKTPHKTSENGFSKNPLHQDVEESETDRVGACYQKTQQKQPSNKTSSALLLSERVCDLKSVQTSKKHTLAKGRVYTDPLGREAEEDGVKRVLKLCKSCYDVATGQKQINEGMKCDLQKNKNDIGHQITSGGLRKDPLGRETKEDKITRVMKLCLGCYQKANKEKKALERESFGLLLIEKECDLKSSSSSKKHKISSLGAIKDPLGRETEEDGVKRVLKLCKNCYNEALGQKQAQEGRKCDLQVNKNDKGHTIRSGGLMKDPLDRTKEVDGKQVALRLCQSCYNNATRQKQLAEGMKCDLHDEGDKEHHILSGGLKKDPQDRTKEVDGKKEVLRLCKGCFSKSLAEKQLAEGMKCDLQVEGNEEGHNTHIDKLREDPQGRVKKEDGISKTLMLCRSCYRKSIAEKQIKEGQRCDLQVHKIDKEHNVTSGGLKKDPLDRTKEIEGKQVTFRLCKSCYREALAQKKSGSKVKEEPEDTPDILLGDGELMVGGSFPIIRKTNDMLPILQDPNDPEKSVLLKEEGPINEIKCASWGVFKNLSKDQKENITGSVRNWLELNEYQREKYSEKLFQLLHVAHPLDEGPDRGMSVFAKKAIKQHEVVCLYAGALHLSEKSLHKSIRHKGSKNVLEYLFGTRSQKRALDAYETGGTASLVNTGTYPGALAFKENNIEAVMFGKNIVAYVALREIKEGEELFLDYGKAYDPQQLLNQSEMLMKEEIF